ncbi:MAG TPA: 16S rRNA (cytosine(1402)-N(4))-methyltransferase RsmH [Kofleriaceae bacterium]|nr:16S rRNA (cytosine(1402)-N(4))-methyltransferase RsmH [Kofleriaceae bacterium]
MSAAGSSGSDFAHESVLLAETIANLSPRNDEIYVDCTLGGAGHSSAILAAAPNARLIGIDRDPAALAAARTRLESGLTTKGRTQLPQPGGQTTLVHGEMGDIRSILADLGITQVHGFLADLGVSSPQLDHADRGFSFSKEGPLDMRMDPTRGPTARDLLRATSEVDLASLISDLGEERHARRIARTIKEALRENEDALRTTTELAALVTKCIPIVEQRKSKIHPATRTFQGLRIAVNAELQQLERFLDAFPDLLAPDGRCVVISFHSLEDRLVKNAFRDLAWSTSLPPKLAQQAGERLEPVVEVLTRKAVFASDEETARNPRARSARLRACRRTAAPNVPMGGSAGDPHLRGRD